MKEKRPPDQSTPRFRYASVDSGLALISALAGAASIFYLLFEFAGPVNNTNRLEFVKTALTMTGFVGVVLAAVYGYRKQRMSEADGHRADYAAYHDRFTTAASQLGSEKAAIRMAGVFSIARLADDWIPLRATCISLLCAYLRMPTDSEGGDQTQETEVRSSIVHIICAHLDPARTPNWTRNSFIFNGVHFPELMLLDDAEVALISFHGATFAGGLSMNRARVGSTINFDEAVIHGVLSMREARFGGIMMFSGAEIKVHPHCIDLRGAEFMGPAIFGPAPRGDSEEQFASELLLDGAKFFDEADFQGCQFSSKVSFKGTAFHKRPKFRAAYFWDDVILDDKFGLCADQAFFMTPDFPPGKLASHFPNAIFMP